MQSKQILHMFVKNYSPFFVLIALVFSLLTSTASAKSMPRLLGDPHHSHQGKKTQLNLLN